MTKKEKMLDFDQLEHIMKLNKLPFCEYISFKNTEFPTKSSNLQYPVVIKAFSPTISHKAINGLVSIVYNESQLRKSYDAVFKNAKKKTKKFKIIIQKFESGAELIIGSKLSPEFGNVVMLGFGGSLVEKLNHLTLRIAPVDRKMAFEMISELGIFEKDNKYNLDTLADIIVNTAKLIEKNKNIIELDFNPVIINEKQAIIADARIAVK